VSNVDGAIGNLLGHAEDQTLVERRDCKPVIQGLLLSDEAFDHRCGLGWACRCSFRQITLP
jgi:hypothetical protein